MTKTQSNESSDDVPVKSILKSDMKKRKRKKLSWCPEDKMTCIRYFDLDVTERCNVSAAATMPPNANANANATPVFVPLHTGSPTTVNSASNNSPQMGQTRFASLQNSPQLRGNQSGMQRPQFRPFSTPEKYPRSQQAFGPDDIQGKPWPGLIALDLGNMGRERGWNSQEKHLATERELVTLGVIDLPGAGPQTIAEPSMY